MGDLLLPQHAGPGPLVLSGVIRPWSEALDKARRECEKDKAKDKNGAPYAVRFRRAPNALPTAPTTPSRRLNSSHILHTPLSTPPLSPQPLVHTRHSPRYSARSPLLPQYSAQPDTFDSIGLGTQLYLQEVKFLAKTFFCMGILAIPLMCFCYYGQKKYKARKSLPLPRASAPFSLLRVRKLLPAAPKSARHAPTHTGPYRGPLVMRTISAPRNPTQPNPTHLPRTGVHVKGGCLRPGDAGHPPRHGAQQRGEAHDGGVSLRLRHGDCPPRGACPPRARRVPAASRRPRSHPC